MINRPHKHIYRAVDHLNTPAPKHDHILECGALSAWHLWETPRSFSNQTEISGYWARYGIWYFVNGLQPLFSEDEGQLLRWEKNISWLLVTDLEICETDSVKKPSTSMSQSARRTCDQLDLQHIPRKTPFPLFIRMLLGSRIPTYVFTSLY